MVVASTIILYLCGVIILYIQLSAMHYVPLCILCGILWVAMDVRMPYHLIIDKLVLDKISTYLPVVVSCQHQPPDFEKMKILFVDYCSQEA